MDTSLPQSNGEQPSTGASQLSCAVACRVTLPTFWPADPELWFMQVEARFRMNRINSQSRQYDLLIDALPPQVAVEVRDHFVSPHPELPYDKIKEALISRMVASELKRLQQLLSTEELGDRRPSQFLRHLQHLLGSKAASLDTAILRELFLQRLPATVRICLAPSHSLPLPELAELADKVTEVTAGAAVNASQQSTRPPSADLTPTHTAIEELQASVRDLSLQVSELHRRTRSPSPYPRSRASSRSSRSGSPRQPSRNTSKLCFYHARFGRAARNCQVPCSWKSENIRANR